MAVIHPAFSCAVCGQSGTAQYVVLLDPLSGRFAHPACLSPQFQQVQNCQIVAEAAFSSLNKEGPQQSLERSFRGLSLRGSPFPK